MTFEPEGNFLYIVGGYNYTTSSSSACRSGGWIASLYLVGGEVKQEHSVITSTTTSHPIQSVCFHESDLITGGPFRGLKYYTTSPLGMFCLFYSHHLC